MPEGTPLGLPTYHNNTDVRAIVTMPTVPQRLRVYVRATGAVMAWEASSSEADDNDLIIEPTDRAGRGGRWIKVALAE